MVKRETLKQRLSLLLRKHPQKVFSSLYATIRVWEGLPHQKKSIVMVLISKKTASRAVQRNLLRRRYREILRKTFPVAPKNLIIQCQIKKQAVNAPFQSLKKDVQDLVSAHGL
jgi:ribonuclease P protein component